jgi:hypothetical protein
VWGLSTKKLVGSALFLIIAYVTFPHPGGRVAWSPAQSLWEVETRMRAWQIEDGGAVPATPGLDPEEAKEVRPFLRLPPSHLTIPYLSMLDIQLEAVSLRGQDKNK